MEDPLFIAGLIYVAGVIACGLAGDQRTVGFAGGFFLGLLCTPLVGAILILAWPGREQIAHYIRMKKHTGQE